MKKLLVGLVLFFAASIALAANPAISVSIDAGGNAILKPALPNGTAYNWQAVAVGETKLLLLVWPEAGRAKVAIYDYQFKDYQPGPTPDPIPDPTPPPIPPDPVPPTPAEPIWGVVVVTESGTITPEQGKVVVSAKVSDFIKGKGWKLSPFDKDATDENNKPIPSLQAWATKAKVLPYFFIVSTKGAIVKEGKLTTEAEMLSVLQTVGGK